MKHTLIILALVGAVGCTSPAYKVQYRNVKTGAKGVGNVKKYYRIGDTINMWLTGDVQIIAILDSNDIVTNW